MNRYIKGRISKGEFISQLFKQRVESIGGTYEANDCLVNSLNSLTDREFKDAKLILTPNGYLVDKLPTIKPNGGGGATIVRNVVKTRVNSSGLIESLPANVLAPDYLNGVCPALNVEGQSTNLLKYSEDFTNAYWDKQNSTVTANTTATIAPDGTNSAEILTSNGGTVSANKACVKRSSVIADTGDGKSYSRTIFVKKGNTRYGWLSSLSASFTNANQVIFDFDTETIASTKDTSDNIISVDFKKLANGWFKLVYNSTNVNSLTISFTAGMTKSPTSIEDHASGDFIYIWGAGFEEGTEATSYIPTTTAQVTRSADTVTIPIPAGTTEIIEKYEDGTTNTITTIPASPYTVPTGKRYEYILMR